MRRWLTVVSLGLALLSASMFAGCTLPLVGTVTGSGFVVTKEYTIGEFAGIKAQGPFEIEVVPSASWSVSVSSNENLFKYIHVDKSGSMLRLNFRNTLFGISVAAPLTLKVRVATPDLRALDLSGASRATADGFKSTEGFRLTASEASVASLSDFSVKDASIRLSGASEASITADGRLDVDLSGASRLEYAGNPTVTGRVEVNDGSTLRKTAY